MASFFLAIILLVSTPGPGVLSTAGFGAAYGFKPGLRYVVGLCIGQAFVIALVVTGLAAAVLAVPWIRTVFLIISTVYLLYLALKIALAGSKIQFIHANHPPGILQGFLLQPINPKAYAVVISLFSGFEIWPDAYWFEVLFKFIALNVIWLPIHLAWLYAGVALERLDLNAKIQRGINVFMAVAMVAVVGLALYSAL